jgi:hypothetical protein
MKMHEKMAIFSIGLRAVLTDLTDSILAKGAFFDEFGGFLGVFHGKMLKKGSFWWFFIE